MGTWASRVRDLESRRNGTSNSCKGGRPDANGAPVPCSPQRELLDASTTSTFLNPKPTRFLKIILNFCYLESEYLAEIIISTGVPNPLEKQP